MFDLTDTDLEENIILAEGAKKQYNMLHKIIADKIQKHASLKSISREIYKKWINKVYNSLTIKNKNYKRFLNTKNSVNFKQYKYYSDQINHLIRKSKKGYYFISRTIKFLCKYVSWILKKLSILWTISCCYSS